MSHRTNRNAFAVLVIALSSLGYVCAIMALRRCGQISHRVAELERRAAWFMPEGQEHPEPVRKP